MNKNIGGGPAFPAYVFAEQISITDHQGMTLRDWFAGQALAGYAARGMDDWLLEDVASHAYAVAGAMLRERDK